jgi:hypothetical protein
MTRSFEAGRGTGMTGNPAAWYPDPARRHQFRYWDGERWTVNVADGGIASVDPSMELPPASDADIPEHLAAVSDPVRDRPRQRRTWLVVLAAAAGLAVGGLAVLSLLGGGSGEQPPVAPLDTEQQSHAIEQLYFDHIPLGLPEPKVIAALGKAPEDAKSYMTKGVVRSGDIKSSCIYYNRLGASFGSRFEFCFKDSLLTQKGSY